MSEALGKNHPFEVMAERISRTTDMPCGGAAVIVPPEGAGEPIEILVLDASADPAQFWANLVSRIQIQVQKLDDVRRVGMAFGR